MDPTELVRRAARGDRGAFDALLGGSIHRLYAIAERILRDPDRAADAVQEALVQAWRDLPGLREPERFDAWLQRLLVRCCYREARRGRAVRHVALLEQDEPTVDDSGHQIADRDRIDRAFRGLRTEYRAVLVVVHYLGYTTADAGHVLGIPQGTVKSRLFHAARLMRAALEAEERAVIGHHRTVA